MTNIFKICAFCGTEFETKKKNQKYCDQMCCRGATNKRIMQKYYEDKARLKGLLRICICGNILSKYNSSTICYICQSEKVVNDEDKIREAVKIVASKISKTKG